MAGQAAFDFVFKEMIPEGAKKDAKPSTSQEESPVSAKKVSLKWRPRSVSDVAPCSQRSCFRGWEGSMRWWAAQLFMGESRQGFFQDFSLIASWRWEVSSPAGIGRWQARIGRWSEQEAWWWHCPFWQQQAACLQKEACHCLSKKKKNLPARRQISLRVRSAKRKSKQVPAQRKAIKSRQMSARPSPIEPVLPGLKALRDSRQSRRLTMKWSRRGSPGTKRWASVC